MIYIPSLTSKAGRVLTVADWRAVDVTCVSCDLGELLVKPGMDVLNALDTLKDYWSWPYELVLNLTSLVRDNSSEQCRVRSDYDGRTLRFSFAAIVAVVDALKPDYVVLPSYLEPLVSQDFPRLSSKKDAFETNKPAEDALIGWMYTADALGYLLTDTCQAHCFSVLHEGCLCPACNTGLTRAYLHHLYAHTPLLCHRWLVMHNQWMAQQHQLIHQARADTLQLSQSHSVQD